MRVDTVGIAGEDVRSVWGAVHQVGKAVYKRTEKSGAGADAVPGVVLRV